MKKNVKIGWLYPDLMSIYGDRGNIICLKNRCIWRGIAVEVVPITLASTQHDIATLDVLFMGGAQDKQQTIVFEDLRKKEKILTELIEKGVPGLYICGGYQFLGSYYKEADGTIIEGLNIFDLYTEHPGEREKRLTGNMAFTAEMITGTNAVLVGFENHGGRTYIGKKMKPFGHVVAGFGNNGTDGYEGAVYKNSIGSYSHGPLLPKNPEIADWLIERALANKYKMEHTLELLDDTLAKKARSLIVQRLRIT